MKRSLKALSLLLTLALLVSMASLAVFADETRDVATCDELVAALADANVTQVNIIADISVPVDGVSGNTGAINVTHPVSIDGGGHTLTATKADSNPNMNGSVLNITSDNVTVTNLKVNGSNLIKHGVNVWGDIEGVTLTGIESRNNCGTGLTVAGAKVTVEGLTTSGNVWGGVNVGTGTGTGDPVVYINGYATSDELLGLYVDGAEAAKVESYLPGIASKVVNLNGSNVVVCGDQANTMPDCVVTTYEGLKLAIADSTISKITLRANIDVPVDSLGDNVAAIEVNRAVTIDGNGNTIKATSTTSTATKGLLIGVSANNVVLENLNVNGDGLVKHGINVFKATGVKLTGISSSNNTGTGLTVNESEVTVDGLATANNGWGGVNVGLGADPSGGTPTLILDGPYTSSNETAGVYTDNPNDFIGYVKVTPDSGLELVKDGNGNWVVQEKADEPVVTPPTEDNTSGNRPNPSTGVSF